MLKELEDIKQKVMTNPTENFLWMQEKAHQDQIHNQSLELEIYWAHRPHDLIWKQKQ